MLRNLLRVFNRLRVHFGSKQPLPSYPTVLFMSFSTRLTMEPIDIDALRASVVKQGGIVRQLKKDGAPQEEVTAGKVWTGPSPF